MNPFGGASVAVKPPEKGSFPLDRAGQVSVRGCALWPCLVAAAVFSLARWTVFDHHRLLLATPATTNAVPQGGARVFGLHRDQRAGLLGCVLLCGWTGV